MLGDRILILIIQLNDSHILTNSELFTTECIHYFACEIKVARCTEESISCPLSLGTQFDCSGSHLPTNSIFTNFLVFSISCQSQRARRLSMLVPKDRHWPMFYSHSLLTQNPKHPREDTNNGCFSSAVWKKSTW